jgi:NADPH-dependent glutamate synthase beta subunit-like oxidoreductase
MFKYQGAFVVNERGKVMDVSGGKDRENQNIHSWKKHGGLNQQWDIVYVD